MMNVMGLPHLLAAGPIRNALLMRGVGAWWMVRIFAAWGGAGAYGNVAVAMTVILLTTAVVWFDARRRNEDLFLGNLGVGRGAILSVGAIPSILGELLLFLLVRSAL